MKNSFLSRYFKKIIRFLGSLLFSMAIMVVLAVVLGWATFIEREFGTPAAQFLVYSSNWFYAVLGTLGLNILCSALIRFPWKRAQIPFLIAHFGILILLIGCWQTMKFGSEAKMTVAEGTSSRRIVSASDWVFDVAVSEKGSDRTVSNVRIPFSAGPFNWADYRFDSWRQNVGLPAEEKLLTRTFGQKIAKKITEWNHCAVWALARFVGSPSPYSIAVPSDFGVPTKNDPVAKNDPAIKNDPIEGDPAAKGGAARDFSIDVLDYLVCADYQSVAPLKIALRRNAGGESESKKNEATDVLFDFGQEMTQTSLENVSRRAIRKTLPTGERVVFILADSDEERRNFASTAPTAAFDDSGCVVLARGGETFQFPVAELANLAQIGSTKLQLALIDYQRELIQKRIDREKAFLTEKAKSDDSNASEPSPKTPDSSPETKSGVLQTLTDDDLQRISKEVYEIQKEVYRARDDASEAATRSLGEKRTELSIASEIRRLEQTAKNSDDFLDRLAKIATEIDETETEIAKLDRLCSLGDSGLTISDFQLVPTLIQDVETMKGWTAQLELTNENGDKDRLQLYSELSERNVPARTFGVFGSLWTNASEKSGETRYGRKWDENLTRPRWEIVQSPSSEIDSTLYYRFWDGKNVVRCGEIPLTSPDARTPYWSSAEVRLDSESPVAVAVAGSENQTKTGDSFNSIQIAQFEPSDELGVRLVAIPFRKDLANEFYAKVRLRVRWDGQDEIFWIRTLPKDGVSPEQEKWLTKTIPGRRNDLKIALTNQTIDLGFALHIDKFRAVYEPGSTTQASFSSQMRYRTIDDSDREPDSDSKTATSETATSEPATSESIVVQMNRPGRFKDLKSGRNYWVYQDSFRGPFFPGDPEFERIVQGKPTSGEAIPRTRLYQTILSFNSDPGRPAKYFGALLIVLGTALLIYRKSRNGMKSDPVVRTIASCLIVSCFCASAALAQDVSTPPNPNPSAADPPSESESPNPSAADPPSDPESSNPSPADPPSDPEPPNPSPADPSSDPESSNPSAADPSSDPESSNPSAADPPSDPESSNPSPADPPSDPEPSNPSPADPPNDPEPSNPSAADPSSDPESSNPSPAAPPSESEPSNPSPADPSSDPESPNPSPADPSSDPESSNPSPAAPPSDPESSNPSPADPSSDPESSNPSPAAPPSDSEPSNPSPADPSSDPESPNPSPADPSSDPESSNPSPAAPPSDPESSNPSPADPPSDPESSNPSAADPPSDPEPSTPSPADPSSDPESPNPSAADPSNDPESPNPSPADPPSDPESSNPSPANETNVLFKIAQKPISETDWKSWRLLPVFDGGRIMPLNTFAILTVKEICGSANPTLFLNEKLIQELEAGNLVNLPSFDEFLAESRMKDRELDDAEKAKMKRWFDESKAVLRLEHREIAEKIRRFFPDRFRKFQAFELLYYWTVFPEIWDYIPFVLDEDATVSQNVLNDFERFASGFDPRRIAPVQVDLNPAYAKRVDAILQQKTAVFAGRRLAEDEGKIDLAVANVEQRLSRFRAATFNPRLVAPPLVRFYLDQILFAEPSPDRRTTIPQSLIEQLDSSIKNLKELAKKEDPSVREKFRSPFDDPEFFLAKTTPLANDSKSRDVLLLMRQLNLIAQIYPEYPLETNVALFDRLFGELQKAQEQTLRFRNEIFAASQYSDAYRQEILRLSYRLSEIVSRFELAYLALTDVGSYSVTKTPNDDRIQERVDSNGKREWLARPGAVLRLSENGTLRVLSPARPLPFHNGESRRSPWLSLQTLLYAPDVMFERFAAADRSSLNDAATLSDWIVELRRIARRADEERSRLYQIQAELCGDEAENPRKIDYPSENALNAELLYYRIDAFYWNWVCSLIALFFLIPSSILGGIAARTRANASEKSGKSRCERWESATFWIGLFFLVVSCSVAFLGGAVRAYITGWAPVTNMFETVVLLAFLISLFTIVYVLRPVGKNPESRGNFLRRKLFLIVGTFLTFAIGLFAYYNSTEFNPNIRPLVAVLRSNFWLTIHVFAIIISYALGAIAWILSLIMLSAYIAGRYPTRRLENGTIRRDDPVICDRLSPTVLGLLRSSVLFLTLGTLLGGFWADCSWGRFWSWDPKEVWALVTLLIYLTVLHGRKAGYYARFGLTIGAVFGALAIIMTWYGLSFVLGGGGRHAYTAGESNKTVVLYALVLVNIFWALLAVVRYGWVKRKSRP